MTFKNITIKKRGGGTRKQRVKVLKSGKYKFVKNVGRKLSRRRKTRSAPRKGGRRKLGRKRRGRRRNSMTIPLAVITGIGAPIADTIQHYMQYKDPFGAFAHLSGALTGYDPSFGDWRPERMTRGLLPIVAGLLIHKFVGGPPLNLNRALGAAKVPFIRI